MTSFRLGSFSLLSALLACTPELDLRSARIDRPRVLAVVGEPPEARPGESVTYVIWTATPDGPAQEPSAEAWHCAQPTPFGSNNTVATTCVSDDSAILESNSFGVFHGEIPADACRVHGPDPPPGDHRPREPDSTGGYYQPLAVRFEGEVAFYLQRIRCNPGDVAADVARDFAERYAPNRNPAPVRLAGPSGIVDDGLEEARSIPTTGARIALELSWGEEAREFYASIDRNRGSIVEQREALRVDWFVVGGQLSRDHDEIAPDSLAANATNELVPDSGVGSAHVFAVVHDGRRGTAVRHLAFEVP